MEETSHWTNHWKSISAQIAQRPRLLLATDFDGTLTPIARTPVEAVLPPKARTLLRDLHASPGVRIAVISGRGLSDVEMHVGIDDLFYAGNHGLEISGPGIELHHPQAFKAYASLHRALAFLVEETAKLEGVFIEDKGATAAVHWRLASEESRKVLQGLVRTAVSVHPRLRLVPGKCVWELRPKDGWNKGDALVHLATRVGLTLNEVVYLGDDVTDEDAFRVVDSDLTFHVGNAGEETAARYHVRDTADALSFLKNVFDVRSGIPPSADQLDLSHSIAKPDAFSFRS